jgi:hypothetical protein
MPIPSERNASLKINPAGIFYFHVKANVFLGLLLPMDTEMMIISVAKEERDSPSTVYAIAYRYSLKKSI